MKRVIEFPLEDGTTILVEVEEERPSGTLDMASRADNLSRKASITFEKAMATVKPAAAAIIGKVRELGDPPDEIQVEFGLKLSAELGAYIAATGVEANYKVALTWKNG